MPTTTTSVSAVADNFNISIIDALYDLSFDWKKVTEKMIKKLLLSPCFPYTIPSASEREDKEPTLPSDTEASHNELESLLNCLSEVKGADFETTAEEYLAI
ncbi:hypothetical protein PoB_003647200 [Plakobranchus ocellatus]|uniref:Uncharacterized protein n=1 Tax=Plakobranchus ocellatus TaxID=259542 RepID=A0AAV4ARK8_9GAST|nr:hypothetical protein PoB_003647200 [Plakobranchus ocellatus]